jgi:hypothetical protein
VHPIDLTATCRRCTALALVSFGVAACSDSPPASPENVQPPAPSAAVTAGQRQALAQLTRAIALALNDEELRHRIKMDMRAAPFAEHKLELTPYVRGRSGGLLLAKMATQAGRGREQMRNMLDDLPELEFYMPVREHRESWRGGTDLIVAGTLEGDDEGKTKVAPVAFDLQGRPVALSFDVAPSTPTLVLVRKEADFSKPMDLTRSRNVNDLDGAAIGTLKPSLIEDCVEPMKAMQFSCGGGGGGGYTPPPSYDPAPGTSPDQQRGISIEEVITHMRTFNDHEPWYKGAPEFYLLLAGRFANGTDMSRRIIIPEGPWSGSDDSSNRKWHIFPEISIFTWDADLGTRVKIQCFESDLNWDANFTVSGTTTYPRQQNAVGQISVTFRIGGSWNDRDDSCGETYIDLQNTLQQWYWIPDGRDDDASYPVPPYRNGTGELEWFGRGYKRVL